MSGISSFGSSPVNPLLPSVTQQTTGTGATTSTTQSTSTLPFETFSDILGVPLVGGNLGLPTSGAPGDSEALLAMIELKLRKTVGQTLNNTDQSNANRYSQALQQAQQLIANIIAAALEITTSQIQYQQDATAISKDSDNLVVLYRPLTGNGNQQDLTKVTADSSGAQGDYGKYLAALQNYNSKKSASDTLTQTLATDQQNVTDTTKAASQTDPTQYYTTTYLARYNQQQALVLKQSQLAGLKPPQTLSTSDAATLATLNGSKSTSGSVAQALDYYTNTLQTNASNATQKLSTDQGSQSSVASNLISAETQLIPYLDRSSGNNFVDNHPQSGSSLTYTFDAAAVQAVSGSSTGLISSELAPINATNSDIQTLKGNQGTLSKTISDDQALLADAQSVLVQLATLINTLSSSQAGRNADATVNANQRISSDILLDHSFDRNQTSTDKLDQSQDGQLQENDLRGRIAKLLSSQPVQTALELAADVTETLSALADLATQPRAPSSTDAYASDALQSAAPRLRIPV